jgi:hypothetical protein
MPTIRNPRREGVDMVIGVSSWDISCHASDSDLILSAAVSASASPRYALPTPVAPSTRGRDRVEWPLCVSTAGNPICVLRGRWDHKGGSKPQRARIDMPSGPSGFIFS